MTKGRVCDKFSNNSSGFAFTVRLNVMVKGSDMIYKLYIVPILTRKLSPTNINQTPQIE